MHLRPTLFPLLSHLCASSEYLLVVYIATHSKATIPNWFLLSTGFHPLQCWTRPTSHLYIYTHSKPMRPNLLPLYKGFTLIFSEHHTHPHAAHTLHHRALHMHIHLSALAIRRSVWRPVWCSVDRFATKMSLLSETRRVAQINASDS